MCFCQAKRLRESRGGDLELGLGKKIIAGFAMNAKCRHPKKIDGWLNSFRHDAIDIFFGKWRFGALIHKTLETGL